MLAAKVDLAQQIWGGVFILLTAGTGFLAASWQARGARKDAAKESEIARSHERDMAREARTQTRRETVYIEAIAAFHRVMMWAERTQPILEMKNPAVPPDVPSDQEMAMTLARLATHASETFRKLVRERWSPALVEFSRSAAMLRDMREWAARPGQGRIEDVYGTTVVAQYDVVDRKRDAMRAALRDLESLAHAELEGETTVRAWSATHRESARNDE